jgi:hypothetical protein
MDFIKDSCASFSLIIISASIRSSSSLITPVFESCFPNLDFLLVFFFGLRLLAAAILESTVPSLSYPPTAELKSANALVAVVDRDLPV